MTVLVITLFVSVILMALGIFLFGYSFLQGDYEHIDALSLLPLEEDAHETGTNHL